MVLNEVFGFSYLDSVFSSIQAAIMRLHWSRVAAKPLYAPLVNTVSDRLGFENWDTNIYRFWRFCIRFSVLIESFFAVFRLWMIFATALRFLIVLSYFRTVEVYTDSCFTNWKSLFLKLQIFFFVLFRVLDYTRPRLVISFKIVYGIL